MKNDYIICNETKIETFYIRHIYSMLHSMFISFLFHLCKFKL